MNKKFILLNTPTFILCLGLIGCANIPSHIIVSPNIELMPNLVHKNKKIKLNIADNRTAEHIVQIVKDGNETIFLAANEKLETTISNTLSKHWEKQKLTLDKNAINKITISIEKAILNINQTTFKYTEQSEIILNVTVNHKLQSLSIAFKNRGNSEGPLKADIAVLERNFNQRLSNLLTQILTSSKIHDFLNSPNRR